MPNRHIRTGGPKKKEGPRDKYGRLIVDLAPDESLEEILKLRRENHGLVEAEVVDQVHPNGKAVFRTRVMKAEAECALDRVRNAGALGTGDDAEIRYRAGEWLRKIFVEAHPGRDTLSAMEGRVSGSSAPAGIGGWSERKIGDVFFIGRVLADLGRYGDEVEAVCCHDISAVRTSHLRAGLDLLADQRGIRRQYEDEQRALQDHDQQHQPEQRAT